MSDKDFIQAVLIVSAQLICNQEPYKIQLEYREVLQ